MKTCAFCGITTPKVYSDGFCLSCHKYVLNGGQFHTPPVKGTVAQDERGYYICHICGTAHQKLGEHIRRKHHLTVEEYKAEFGLCKSQRLTADEYHNKMREHNIRTNASQNFDGNDEYKFTKGMVGIRVGQERREQEKIKLRKQSEEIKKKRG